MDPSFGLHLHTNIASLCCITVRVRFHIRSIFHDVQGRIKTDPYLYGISLISMQVMFFSIAYIYSDAAFLGTYSVLKRLLIHGCDAFMSIISNFQNTKTFHCTIQEFTDEDCNARPEVK